MIGAPAAAAMISGLALDVSTGVRVVAATEHCQPLLTGHGHTSTGIDRLVLATVVAEFSFGRLHNPLPGMVSSVAGHELSEMAMSSREGVWVAA